MVLRVHLRQIRVEIHVRRLGTSNKMCEPLRGPKRSCRNVHVPEASSQRLHCKLELCRPLNEGSFNLSKLRDILDLAENSGQYSILSAHGRDGEHGLDRRPIRS